MQILPIVEKQVFDNLKGFINKQVDLSFCFEGYPIEKRASENKKFAVSAKDITKHILEESSKPNYNLKPGGISLVDRGLSITL